MFHWRYILIVLTVFNSERFFKRAVQLVLQNFGVTDTFENVVYTLEPFICKNLYSQDFACNAWSSAANLLGTLSFLLYRPLLAVPCYGWLEKASRLHLEIFLFSSAGLIDYNFHCFRKAIHEVFEVRMKVVKSRKVQNRLQKKKGATPNGTPRVLL